MKMTVSEYMIKFFEDKGIDTTFLVSGGGIMFITDALAKSDKIKTICNHNEQASSMCADAYARVKNGIGLCIATSGPGATNLITGVAGAWVDSIPVFAVSGQSKLSQTLQGSDNPYIRQYGLQELNIIDLVKPITKYAIMIDNAEDIRYHLEKAYSLATKGRCGPVWIDVPVDIQGATIESEKLRGYEVESLTLKEYDINSVIEMLQSSKRLVIIAGNGIKLAGGKKSFEIFIEKYNIPVVTTPLGADLIEYDSPNFVGHMGIKGDRAGNFAVTNADLILSIGSSLHVSQIGYEEDTFAIGVKKIVVDIDEHQLNKHKCAIDLRINEDSKIFLDKLLQIKLDLNIDKMWIEYTQNLKAKYPVIAEPHKKENDRVNYYEIIEKLNQAIKNIDKFTSVSYDAGSAFYVVGQAIKVTKNQKIIAPGGFGGMGYALPAAMGAYYGNQSYIPICITGDGSFQMNLQELEVIKANNIPVKIIVINNDGYVSIRNTQERFFKRFIAEGPTSGVTNPDFGKICNAYDINYRYLNDNNDLVEEFSKMLLSNSAEFCEVSSNIYQELLPVNTSKKLDSGKIVSAPIEDMYPFLDRDEFHSQMIIKPMEE
jgi:acetolactate synthase-1/2/3 large subunit